MVEIFLLNLFNCKRKLNDSSILKAVDLHDIFINTQINSRRIGVTLPMQTKDRETRSLSKSKVIK